MVDFGSSKSEHTCWSLDTLKDAFMFDYDSKAECGQN